MTTFPEFYKGNPLRYRTLSGYEATATFHAGGVSYLRIDVDGRKPYQPIMCGAEAAVFFNNAKRHEIPNAGGE